MGVHEEAVKEDSETPKETSRLVSGRVLVKSQLLVYVRRGLRSRQPLQDRSRPAAGTRGQRELQPSQLQPRSWGLPRAGWVLQDPAPAVTAQHFP